MNRSDDFRITHKLENEHIITYFISTQDIEKRNEVYNNFVKTLELQNTVKDDIDKIIESMKVYNPTGSNVIIFFRNVLVDEDRVEQVISDIYIFDKDVAFSCSPQLGIATFVINQYHYYELGYDNYCYMLHRKPKRLKIL